MSRLLVGYDGSEPSRRALAFALRKAKALGDEVVLLTVIPPSVARSSLSAMMPAGVELPPSMAKTFETNARERLDDVVKENATSGVKVSALVRAGEPGHVFLE